MEPFFLVCLECHRARVWHHRSDTMKCQNGCEEHFSKPWFNGFGPDKKSVARHHSSLYGDGDELPDYDVIPNHIANEAEMRKILE